MKNLWIVIVIGLVLYFGISALRDEPRVTSAQALVQNTSAPKPTKTQAPPPTIDYNATAEEYKDAAQTAIADSQHAVATSNEAMRINAQATSDHEQRVLDQIQITSVHEQNLVQIFGFTATSALTSVPLTATQQRISNTASAEQRQLEAGRMTATNAAPTQYTAMVRARNEERYGWMSYAAFLIISIVISGFLVAVIRWVWRNPIVSKSEPVIEQKEETIIWTRNKSGTSTKRYAVPCSPEQLTELAELVVNGEKTFGINRLEKSSRTLRRYALYQVREFLTLNNLAVDAGAGQIALNDDGAEFLTAWFENHELPKEYSFDGGEEPDEINESVNQ